MPARRAPQAGGPAAARAARPRGVSVILAGWNGAWGRRGAARNGTITVPAEEACRALRLDLPGIQVEVILRDHDLVLLPHVTVPLERFCDDGTVPAPGIG